MNMDAPGCKACKPTNLSQTLKTNSKTFKLLDTNINANSAMILFNTKVVIAVVTTVQSNNPTIYKHADITYFLFMKPYIWHD